MTTSLTVLNDSAIAPRWAEIRNAATEAWDCRMRGYVPDNIRSRILSMPGDNTKLAKGSTPIFGLTLAPAGASGYQLCPWRSPECEAACLGITAGRSRFSNVQQARIDKTRLLMDEPFRFMAQLYKELHRARAYHGHTGWAFRSNVLSDIPWEDIAPQVYRFCRNNYDYTKSYQRAVRSLNPADTNVFLDLTLSYSGHNWDECESYMKLGGRSAVVFSVGKGDPLPEEYRGWEVIEGDENDCRFRDKAGCIVGLRAKGKINKGSKFIVSDF